MFTSDVKVISMSDSIDNKKTTKTISLSDLNTTLDNSTKTISLSNLNTTLDNSTKTISLNSPKKNKKKIKSILLLDNYNSDIKTAS